MRSNKGGGGSRGDYDDYDDDYGSRRGSRPQSSDYDYSYDGRDDGYSGRDRTSRMSGSRRGGGYGGGGGDVQEQLKDLINSPATRNRCGECQATFPTWCSINLGVFLCGRCASVHRKLLTGRSDEVYSNLKSVSLDRWTRQDLEEVGRLGGNRGNEETWNPKKEPFPFDGDDDKTQVERYIREKYILGKYRYSEVRPEDFGARDSGRSERYEGGRSERYGSGRSDSYRRESASASSSRDSYRRESGSASSRRENSSSTSRPAPATASDLTLPPRRPAATTRPAVFDGTATMTQAATSAAPVQAQTTGLVQQYYDPNTGVVYMDQQQYAATMQQQQQLAMQQQVAMQQQAAMQQQQALQQQAMQQQAMQQQQQANKNALMGLYARPDLYTSPVEITPSNPLYAQMTQQQQQQQQMQQQMQQQQGYPQQPFQ